MKVAMQGKNMARTPPPTTHHQLLGGQRQGRQPPRHPASQRQPYLFPVQLFTLAKEVFDVFFRRLFYLLWLCSKVLVRLG